MGLEHAVVVPAGAGRVILDQRWWLKVGGDQTLGGLSVLEMEAAPGTLPPKPHRHVDSEEMWYVLAGQLRFSIEDEHLDAPAGTFVVVPRGVVHSLWNPDLDRSSRYLLLLSPSGMEGYFEELGDLIATGKDDAAARERVSAKYKVEYPDT